MMPGIGVMAISPCACPAPGAEVMTRPAAAARRNLVFMALTLRPTARLAQDRGVERRTRGGASTGRRGSGDQRFEDVGFGRLGDVAIEACGKRAALIFLLPPPRQRHEDDPPAQRGADT